MKYERIVIYVVANVAYLFGSFFDNATFYGSASMGTPSVAQSQVIQDEDYKYNFGIRKIALFPYQSRSRYYKGDEESLSDKAIVGAVDGWEYLFKYSKVRNRGNEYKDGEVWVKWSNEKFVSKFKYVNKESRDLEFAEMDFRYRKHFWIIDYTTGFTVKGHPVYGHPAIEDYDGYWWDLAYQYGYEDYLVPLNDMNGNGEIDDYWVWIETDPETLDGYWTYYYEDADYYWEDADSNAVAYSDSEFLQYHYPKVIKLYNEDNKEKEWQAELYAVIGFDVLMGSRESKFYSHLWVNIFPYTYKLTNKAYEGKDRQYDVGLLLGTDIGEHIGVFIEGTKTSFYGKEEKHITTGLNWRF